LFPDCHHVVAKVLWCLQYGDKQVLSHRRARPDGRRRAPKNKNKAGSQRAARQAGQEAGGGGARSRGAGPGGAGGASRTKFLAAGGADSTAITSRLLSTTRGGVPTANHMSRMRRDDHC
jgi:hypothetical protein